MSRREIAAVHEAVPSGRVARSKDRRLSPMPALIVTLMAGAPVIGLLVPDPARALVQESAGPWLPILLVSLAATLTPWIRPPAILPAAPFPGHGGDPGERRYSDPEEPEE